MWVKIVRYQETSFVNLASCTDIYCTDKQITFCVGDCRVAVIDEFKDENHRQKIINQIDEILINQRQLSVINIHTDE